MDRGIETRGEKKGGPVSADARSQSADREASPEDKSRFEGKARIADYIFLLRPVILIPVWTFFLLGAHHGSAASGRYIQIEKLLSGIASFTALIGAVYIINQIADREADLANDKLFIIPHGIVSIGRAWLETGALIVLSFLIGFLLLPGAFMSILIISLALGASYSLEPVRLKKRPILDVAANAVGNGILNTLAGWIAVGASLSNWQVLIPYPLAVASVHLTTTLADIEGDARTGLRTSGVVTGLKRGRMISAGLMVASLAASAAVGNRLAFYASLFSLPMFLLTAGSYRGWRAQPGILLPAKVATLIFSVTAGFLFPLYIPFLAAVILLTRLYYSRRFGMNYPSF